MVLPSFLLPLQSEASATLLMYYTAEPAFAVFGVWLGLRLAGHWQPEPDWRDRAGRLLGAAWFVANALNGIRFLLYRF
jgi:hypothetical protein